ncbi:hypothetical protein BGX26_005220 [Mortierella sp. AD094]|nr:hypothetical protein BGX26_005220 [Mortierella sp. AD094]
MKVSAIYIAVFSFVIILAASDNLLVAALPVSMPPPLGSISPKNDGTVTKSLAALDRLPLPLAAERCDLTRASLHKSFIPGEKRGDNPVSEVMPHYQREKRAITGSSSEDYITSHSLSVMDTESNGEAIRR